MPAKPDFSDENQAVNYIPFHASDEDALDDRHHLINAYERAWGKCLKRIDAVIRDLYTPTVNTIAQRIRSSSAISTPHLPYPEIPIIYAPNAASDPHLISSLSTSLRELPESYFVNNMFPIDCSNISQCMRTLIMGFINQCEESNAARKSTKSLGENNIELLKAWSRQFVDAGDAQPVLVVVVHEFEKFDHEVLQDMFSILSLHCREIRVIFLILASNSLRSFMTVTYPISILSLLDIEIVEIPPLCSVLETVVMETFFNLETPMDLVPSSTIYRFINEHTIRTNTSLDATISVLQLSYMKHFEQELAVFTPERTTTDFGKLPFSSHKDLLARLLLHSPPSERDDLWNECSESPRYLHERLQQARQVVSARYRNISLGVVTLHRLHNFLSLQGALTKRSPPWLSTLSAVLEGDWIAYYLDIIKSIESLPSEDLSALGTSLHQLYNHLPTDLISERSNGTRALIVKMINNESAGGPRAVMKDATEKLQGYLGYLFAPVTDLPLSELWITQSTPFPNELFNPNIRQSIFTALIHPEDYSTHSLDSQALDSIPVTENTDTGILFSLYLQSGRSVNVHDWFEAFCSVVEQQKDDEQEVEGAEEDNVAQARFIRALHELDYMGFIRHTGRKADHINRTVFDCLL